MKIKDAEKILLEAKGKHIDKIYLPSLGRDVMFSPLSTADVKTLTRMSFLDVFDLNVEGLKLGLFDKLCQEDLSDSAVLDEQGQILKPAISAQTITQLDYLSFLIGIRQMLNNDVIFSFTCNKPGCNTQFEHKINLFEEFYDILHEFKPQHEFFEKVDKKTGNIWKFELTNFTMMDYLYFRFFMEKLGDTDANSPEVEYETKFVKPILYVKNIWLNDEIIEDWQGLTIPDKLLFWNKISPDITINTIGTNNETIYDFIKNTFYEEKLDKQINEMIVQCPNCNNKWSGVFAFDNFFIF
jgi:hypothetical protein